MPENYTAIQWVIFYAFLSTLLPISIGLIRYSKLVQGMLSIFWFCVATLVLESIGTVLWIAKTPNLWIGHIYTIVEFSLLANAYRIALKGFIKPILIPSMILLFTILAVSNTLFLQSFKYNNSNIKIIEAVLLIGLALLLFYKLARELKISRLEKYPMFWVSCAVIIYFSSNIFVFMYSNYLLQYSKLLGMRIWFIHALFFVLFHIMLALSLWSSPPNRNLHG